jgi:hypothetical protein
MLCSLSTKLGSEDLKAISDLEKDLATSLLAFACHQIRKRLNPESDPAPRHRSGSKQLLKIRRSGADQGRFPRLAVFDSEIHGAKPPEV